MSIQSGEITDDGPGFTAYLAVETAASESRQAECLARVLNITPVASKLSAIILTQVPALPFFLAPGGQV